MASTHHFALGVKTMACDNFLDKNWGTIEFFEKKKNELCYIKSEEDQNQRIQSFLARALLQNGLNNITMASRRPLMKTAKFKLQNGLKMASDNP